MALALSGGFRGGYRGSYASLYVVPLADDEGGKKRRGFHYTAKRFLAELDAGRGRAQRPRAARCASSGARKVPTCEAPVVFDPDAARSIIGTFAGCVMGGAIWRKSSYLAGREGTRSRARSSPSSTIRSYRAPPARAPFDGEGLLARKNMRRRARRAQDVPLRQLRRPQARSRFDRQAPRADRAAASGASTSNFILKPGDLSNRRDHRSHRARSLRHRDDGLRLQRGHRRLLARRAGFWIENGELTYPVSEVTISLNLDELLKRIDLVGNDLDWRSSTVSPTLRISSMTIAGV